MSDEKIFSDWYKKSDCKLTGVTKGIARCIWQAGAQTYKKDYKETEALLDKQIEATLKLDKENEALKADKAEAQKIIRELIEIIEPLGNFSGGVFDRAKDFSKADKMKKLIFAYWIIYEQFYKRRKGYKTDFFKSWRNAFRNLKRRPGFYDEARRIHEREKADK